MEILINVVGFTETKLGFTKFRRNFCQSSFDVEEIVTEGTPVTTNYTIIERQRTEDFARPTSKK